MKQERIEWINTWSEDTNNTDLPRVLLIGDSITQGYQGIVREALRGICYVDYVSTSYTLNSAFFFKLVLGLAKNNKYAIYHINQGLHGFSMSGRTYKTKYEKLIKQLPSDSKVILATSTMMNKEGNKKVDKKWEKKILERNNIVKELASLHKFPVNPLYEVSKTIPNNYRNEDGCHYIFEGYKILAESVISSIRAKIEQ